MGEIFISFDQYLICCFIRGAMCLVYQASSYELNSILLEPVATKVAYLNISFVLEMACNAEQVISRTNSMIKLANFGEDHPSKMIF